VGIGSEKCHRQALHLPRPSFFGLLQSRRVASTCVLALRVVRRALLLLLVPGLDGSMGSRLGFLGLLDYAVALFLAPARMSGLMTSRTRWRALSSM
jgi:hypothetical protein